MKMVVPSRPWAAVASPRCGDAPHIEFAGCDGRVFHRVGWHRETWAVQSPGTYWEGSSCHLFVLPGHYDNDRSM